MNASSAHPPIQFKLRTLLVATLVVALVIINWPIIAEYLLGNFYVLGVGVFIFGWWVGQRMAFEFHDRIPKPFRRWGLWCVLLPTILLCVISFWFRHRWLESFRDPLWPRSFPYPDELLMSFREWLFRQDPAQPGAWRIDGEPYTVLASLNPTCISLCILLGIIVGALWPKAFSSLYIFCHSIFCQIAHRTKD